MGEAIKEKQMTGASFHYKLERTCLLLGFHLQKVACYYTSDYLQKRY
jgi:hypothetical protein